MKFYVSLELWRNFIFVDECFYFEYFLSLRLLLHGSFLRDFGTIGEETVPDPIVKEFTEELNSGCEGRTEDGSGAAAAGGAATGRFFFLDTFLYLNVAG